jgi:O-antigen ligase
MTHLKSIVRSEQQDQSAIDRLLAWNAALSMSREHPFGVGVNNFKIRAAEYEYSLSGRDTHNTYLRALAELGIQGITLLLLLMATALWKAYRLHLGRGIEAYDYRLMGWAAGIALTIYMSAGMFISLTYIEDFYLLLMLPDALARTRRGEDALERHSLSPRFTKGEVHG